MQGPWLALAQPGMGSGSCITQASVTLLLPHQGSQEMKRCLQLREASTHATRLAASQQATGLWQLALTLEAGQDCQKGQDCWNKQTNQPVACTLPGVIPIHCTLLPFSSLQQPEGASLGSAAVLRWLLHARAQPSVQKPICRAISQHHTGAAAARVPQGHGSFHSTDHRLCPWRSGTDRHGAPSSRMSAAPFRSVAE